MAETNMATVLLLVKTLGKLQIMASGKVKPNYDFDFCEALTTDTEMAVQIS